MAATPLKLPSRRGTRAVRMVHRRGTQTPTSALHAVCFAPRSHRSSCSRHATCDLRCRLRRKRGQQRGNESQGEGPPVVLSQAFLFVPSSASPSHVLHHHLALLPCPTSSSTTQGRLHDAGRPAGQPTDAQTASGGDGGASTSRYRKLDDIDISRPGLACPGWEGPAIPLARPQITPDPHNQPQLGPIGPPPEGRACSGIPSNSKKESASHPGSWMFGRIPVNIWSPRWHGLYSTCTELRPNRRSLARFRGRLIPLNLQFHSGPHRAP